MIEEYDEGYYIKLEGTRSSFQAFVLLDGGVVRKPRVLSEMIGYYNVEGRSGTVEHMSRRRKA